MKLHLRLEYQAHSTLPLQRSGPVHSSSRSYLFPAQGWNLWSLEGKPSYLITEFFLAWLLVARMQMGSRYSSLDRPLSCPAPLRPRHSALSCRWAHLHMLEWLTGSPPCRSPALGWWAGRGQWRRLGRGAGSDEKAHVALEREQQTPIIVLNEGQLGLSFVWQMKGREVMLALQNRADQNKQQSTKILLETKMALSWFRKFYNLHYRRRTMKKRR